MKEIVTVSSGSILNRAQASRPHQQGPRMLCTICGVKEVEEDDVECADCLEILTGRPAGMIPSLPKGDDGGAGQREMSEDEGFAIQREEVEDLLNRDELLSLDEGALTEGENYLLREVYGVRPKVEAPNEV